MLYNINMCLFRLAVNFTEIRKKMSNLYFFCSLHFSDVCKKYTVMEISPFVTSQKTQLVAEAPSTSPSLWQTSFFWSTFKHVEGYI